jgi:hypothetical protein
MELRFDSFPSKNLRYVPVRASDMNVARQQAESACAAMRVSHRRDNVIGA